MSIYDGVGVWCALIGVFTPVAWGPALVNKWKKLPTYCTDVVEIVNTAAAQQSSWR